MSQLDNPCIEIIKLSWAKPCVIIEKKDWNKPVTQSERVYPDRKGEWQAGDYEGKAHPDGKPWPKCCGNKTNTTCAYRKAKYLNKSPIARVSDNECFACVPHSTGDRFFCCHRKTEDGYYRICAGWAATQEKYLK